MDTKGGGSLKTTRVSEWTINQGGYIPISFGSLLILGCVTAYVIAVLRGNVDAFLPLISDAAGSPPQNGLFGVLVCFGAMMGVVFMFLRYLIVLEQNDTKGKTIEYLNKISLAVGITSLFGICLIAGYPANFYRDRDVWLNHVGIPHMMGGVLLFALGLIYIAMQCILTLFLRSSYQFTVFIRICLCLAATAAFVYHIITVPDNFGAVKMLKNLTLTTLGTNITVTQMPLGDLRLHIDMSDTYIPSAISQWLLVFLYCSFFFTFFKEVQEYSLLVVIETCDPDLDVQGEVAGDDYGTKDGPSTYTRKTSHAYGNFPSGISDAAHRKQSGNLGLRRDSSCQTKNDAFTKDGLKTNGNSKPKPMDSKPMDSKPMDFKPMDSKPMDSKPMDSKPKSVEANGLNEANGIKDEKHVSNDKSEAPSSDPVTQENDTTATKDTNETESSEIPPLKK